MGISKTSEKKQSYVLAECKAVRCYALGDFDEKSCRPLHGYDLARLGQLVNEEDWQQDNSDSITYLEFVRAELLLSACRRGTQRPAIKMMFESRRIRVAHIQRSNHGRAA